MLSVVLGGVMTYFAIVPLGASPLPWLLARVDGPVLRSPDGGTTLWVYFNDSGAMHSGNHWTWVVSEGSLGFRRVVAEGYLDGSVAVKRAAVPCEWLPDGSVRIHFLAHRRGDESVAQEWLP